MSVRISADRSTHVSGETGVQNTVETTPPAVHHPVPISSGALSEIRLAEQTSFERLRTRNTVPKQMNTTGSLLRRATPRQAESSVVVRTLGAVPASSDIGSVERTLHSFELQWRSLSEATRRAEQAVPPEIRPLLRYQRIAQEIALNLQTVSQFAEAISSTIRRVQQLGSN